MQALDDACASRRGDRGAAGLPVDDSAARTGPSISGAGRIGDDLFSQLMDGESGPITATGKIKRVFMHYVTVCQQQARTAARSACQSPRATCCRRARVAVAAGLSPCG